MLELKKLDSQNYLDATHPYRIYRTAQNFFSYAASVRTRLWHRAVRDGNGNFHRSIQRKFLLLRQQDL